MWWIIIGAVVALVVMIVLIVMFTGRGTKLEQGLLDCQSKGGRCDYSTPDLCRAAKGTPSMAFDCPDTTSPCCFGVKDVNTNS